MVQHPTNVVLLDLDGTLTQSDPGIIACVVKAFEGMGLPVPSHEELHRFIGPAIVESFRRNHVPESMMDKGISIYRSYYADKAVFDDPNHPGCKVPGRLFNRVYDGIDDQLRLLRDQGYYLAIATCKPEYQALPICEHFHLDSQVDAVYGASSDSSRLDKDQVIRYAFDTMGFDKDRGDQALMIGDRWTDVDGAVACGLDCLGCGWGYAEPHELERHGAYRVIDEVNDMEPAVTRYFSNRTQSHDQQRHDQQRD
ncbi:MAG: HAD hydrolase-like protein [Bifidobacterium sp.]|jgi:phosphoglycolate phosphatase|nr:HAD hydrolase-like protein [Bifidobacterium sp.]MCI1864519.1 HAD hydrolase-like protein [Bifidobacterium sp.]